jgi:hypothetical protein
MNEKETENEYGEYDALEKHCGHPRAHLIDHGHNSISVGDDPLLKRLIAKHGDRRY